MSIKNKLKTAWTPRVTRRKIEMAEFLPGSEGFAFSLMKFQ